ncbi:MAG TPA: hypothetical protein VMT51_13355, partial [Dongiaceae bacterium]|nr:hypothetical protein [Dongiaceae bacterium]
NLSFLITGEKKLAGVPSLCHVIWNVNQGDTTKTRHSLKLSENVPSVPRLSGVPRVGFAGLLVVTGERGKSHAFGMGLSDWLRNQKETMVPGVGVEPT